MKSYFGAQRQKVKFDLLRTLFVTDFGDSYFDQYFVSVFYSVLKKKENIFWDKIKQKLKKNKKKCSQIFKILQGAGTQQSC